MTTERESEHHVPADHGYNVPAACTGCDITLNYNPDCYWGYGPNCAVCGSCRERLIGAMLYEDDPRVQGEY